MGACRRVQLNREMAFSCCMSVWTFKDGAPEKIYALAQTSDGFLAGHADGACSIRRHTVRTVPFVVRQSARVDKHRLLYAPFGRPLDQLHLRRHDLPEPRDRHQLRR